jgi:hypothetical protein
MDLIFFPRHFSGIIRIGEEEVKEEREEAQKRGHHVGLLPGHMVWPISGLVRPFNANFISMDSS